MKKGTKLIIAFVLIVGVAAGSAYGGYQYLLAKRQAGLFVGKTIINGVSVDGMTPDEAGEKLIPRPDMFSLSLTEGNETVLSGTLPEYGFTVNKESFMNDLDRIFRQQTENILSVIKSSFVEEAYTIDAGYVFDEDTLTDYVNGDALSIERSPGTDAELLFDKKDKVCYVKPEVNGNELSDKKLQSFVKDTLEKAAEKSAFAAEKVKKEITDIECPIPDEIYLDTNKRIPAETFEKECDQLNHYAHASITYTFGSEKKELDFETFRDWLSFTDTDSEAVIDDEAVLKYVEELSDTYNTKWRDRPFHTTYGSDIVIPASLNEYGYRINVDEEIAQLKADIIGNKSVEREPCYYQYTSYGNPYYYKREGVDDLAGTYVEVNLGAQHLWYYIDGKLFIESDLVSGDMSEKGRATASGAFPLAYKERDVTLRGGEGDEEYESDVKYWMAFYEGQGLHDASWRSSFGGNIYKYNGSHGCVNLPESVAKTIYENISPGIAIILYY